MIFVKIFPKQILHFQILLNHAHQLIFVQTVLLDTLEVDIWHVKILTSCHFFLLKILFVCFFFFNNFFFFRCATNNGYCENSLCINTPGSYQCGSCYQGYSGLPCAWIPYFATLRLTNVEVETNNISLTTFYAIAKGYTLANYEFTIQSVNDDPIFVYRSPAGTRARQIVQVRPGNYSIYPGYFFNIPVPYYREGIVQTQVSNGDDVFLTSFLVKRPTTASTEGIAVLDYQSTSASKKFFFLFFLWTDFF